MTKSEIMVQYCIDQLGAPYVFGARGQKCTPSYRGGIRQSTKDAHPTIVSKCQVLNGKSKFCAGCEFAGKLCFDCRGLTYCAAKEAGLRLMGAGATSQWNDENNWSQKGLIKDIPDRPCVVFRQDGKTMKHTGLYIGDGYFIDASVNVRKRKMSDYGWTHYGILHGMYGDMPEAPTEPQEGIPATIRKGSEGELVKALQNLLNQNGEDLDVDGKFGPMTYAAVKAYQALRGLEVDGIVGPNTWSELLAEEPPEDEEPQEVLYVVHIGNLTEDEAKALVQQYPGATVEQQS